MAEISNKMSVSFSCDHKDTKLGKQRRYRGQWS